MTHNDGEIAWKISNVYRKISSVNLHSLWAHISSMRLYTSNTWYEIHTKSV